MGYDTVHCEWASHLPPPATQDPPVVGGRRFHRRHDVVLGVVCREVVAEREGRWILPDIETKEHILTYIADISANDIPG